MIIITFTLILASIIYYYVRKFNKIPKGLENLPHVSGIPSAWAWLRKRPYDEIQDVIYETAAKDNDIFLTRLGSFTQLSIVSPDALKVFLMESEDIAPKFNDYPPEDLLYKFFGVGLPFANGDMWRHYRNVSNLTFNEVMSPDSIEKTMFDHFALLQTKLNQPVEVFEDLQRFTIEAMGNKLFGYEFGCYKTMEIPRLIEVYKNLMNYVESPYYQIFPWVSSLPLETNKTFFKLLEEFEGFMYDVINTKKSEIDNNKQREDLFTSIILSDKSASDKKLRDILVNFFVAGHETTAMALSTILYYLAKYPEIQEKARAEAIKILGNEPVIPNSEQLKELKYITGVIRESLRIHPPTPIITFRKLAKPIKLGPHVIPKDTVVSANAWQIHNNSKYWNNPKQFKPERFLHSDDKRHQFAWIPFSAGPRNCVGQNFSILEQRVFLSMLLLKYKWTLPENCVNKDKLLLTSQVLLRPSDLKIVFSERVR